MPTAVESWSTFLLKDGFFFFATSYVSFFVVVEKQRNRVKEDIQCSVTRDPCWIGQITDSTFPLLTLSPPYFYHRCRPAAGQTLFWWLWSEVFQRSPPVAVLFHMFSFNYKKFLSHSSWNSSGNRRSQFMQLYSTCNSKWLTNSRQYTWMQAKQDKQKHRMFSNAREEVSHELYWKRNFGKWNQKEAYCREAMIFCKV